MLYNKNDSVSSVSSEIIYKKFTGKKEIYYLEAPHEAEREAEVIRKVLDKLEEKHLVETRLKKKKNMWNSHISKAVMKPVMMA